MITLDVKIDDAAIRAALRRMVAAGADLTPAFADIGEVLLASTKDRFRAGESPDGVPWAPNSPVTLARKRDPRPLFGETKRLSSEISYDVSRDALEVGSSLIYAAVQQFGAKAGSFAPGVPWGDIPARPFLGISRDDLDAISEILGDYAEAPFDPS